MSKEQMIELHADLKNFGLNPAEWSLKQMRSLQIKIEHRLDSSFAFLGVATKKNKRLKWENLKLISL